jgi:hypothetical protein
VSTAKGAVTYDWKSIWIFSAVVSAAVLLFFLVSFSEKSQLSSAEETGHLDVPVVSDALPQ